MAFGASLPVVPIAVHDLGSEALHLKSLITGLKPDLLCFADTEAGHELAARMADAVGQRAYKGFAVPDAVVGKNTFKQTHCLTYCAAHYVRHSNVAECCTCICSVEHLQQCANARISSQ
jgi:hypothetical protein